MINSNASATPYITKTSSVNDAVHHISLAYQTTGLSGTSQNIFATLYDGATAQCTVSIRSDGNMYLLAGNVNGSILATYTTAVAAANTWYQFEVEVVINNTTGSMAVRRNGNVVNDFSATGLNTRASANNYANKIGLGGGIGLNNANLDDFIWRSDASSVPWIGDVRGWARMPVSDASVQWTPSSAALPVQTIAFSSSAASSNTVARFGAFTAPVNGSIGTVSLVPGVVWTGNIKCSLFASSASTPGAVLGSATTLSTLPSGTPAIFTFGTPVAVTAGTQYWIGIIGDTAVGSVIPIGSGLTGVQHSSTTYAAFPVANPPTAAASALAATANISVTGNPNTAMVQEAQQDAANSYVYSSTVGQSDRYGIAPISSTPSSVVAVVTRAYCQKSDAGTRNVAVQLQSGATNVQGTSTALNTTWGWLSRTDLTDPATGAAWTAVGVNNAQIGAVVTA